MTYQEVNAFVESLGFPCAYYQFEKSTADSPPFICWLMEGDNDLQADDINYSRIRPLAIEYYTDVKDFAGETRIENALDAAGMPYSKDEIYLVSERMNEEIYTTEVVINA